MRKAADAAGIEANSGYALRRGLATRLADGGLDVFQLDEVMGHADITLSREYVQQSRTARSRVLAALGERPQLTAVQPPAQRGTHGTDRGTNLDSQPPAEAPKRSPRKAR